MGRSKQLAPKKRQRVEEVIIHKDHLKEQKDAIQALLSAPQAEVEKAAAQATAEIIKLWPRLDDSLSFSLSIPNTFRGIGWCKLPLKDLEVFSKLHETIKNKTSNTSWSGSIEDPRRRSFGFLPNTLGHREDVRKNYLDISTPFLKEEDNSKVVNEERIRNTRAGVLLLEEDIPIGFDIVLDRTIEKFKKKLEVVLDDDDKYKDKILKYLKKETLVAAQPNLHGGRALLPAHIDHPSKDGFGVVIITIGITGTADILLQNYDNTKRGVFTLQEGEAYMLSDRVRNECTHGVLARNGSEHRESLNLRFGLHGVTPDGTVDDDDDDDVVVNSNDVLKYWN